MPEKNKKTYPVPTELVKLMDESKAAKAARDSAVCGFFKFQVRNAVYLGRIAIEKERKFWKQIRDLYPELGNVIGYDSNEQVVWTEEA